MDWRVFLKPTFHKILLTFVVFAILFLIFGVPVMKFPLCKTGAPCFLAPALISVPEFLTSTDVIGKGIWLFWYAYIFELVLSYLIASIVLSVYEKSKK